jgi:hypothetical protein
LLSQNGTVFDDEMARGNIWAAVIRRTWARVEQHLSAFLFPINDLQEFWGTRKFTLRFCSWLPGNLLKGRVEWSLDAGDRLSYISTTRILKKRCLECDDPMNAVCAKDAELAFVVAAKIDLAAATLPCTGERHLMDGALSLQIFVFEQHDRLACHGS